MLENIECSGRVADGLLEKYSKPSRTLSRAHPLPQPDERRAHFVAITKPASWDTSVISVLIDTVDHGLHQQQDRNHNHHRDCLACLHYPVLGVLRGSIRHVAEHRHPAGFNACCVGHCCRDVDTNDPHLDGNRKSGTRRLRKIYIPTLFCCSA
jgi:hypothetical protein